MSNLVVRDGTDALQYLQAFGQGTNLNPFMLTNSDFLFEVSRGNVVGASSIHKFGLAEDIDTGDGLVDIWDGCSNDIPSKIPTYTFSSTADITQLSSTSAADTQDIVVEGLDASWNLVSQTVTLTGQTPASLGTPLLRAFRMYNAGSTSIAGTVYLSTSGATIVAGEVTSTTDVRAIIHGGVEDHNQTQMAIYSVPAGYDLYMTEAWSNMARDGVSSATVKVYSRTNGGVFRIAHTLALQTTGASGDHRPYRLPLKFEAQSDIIYRASVTDNNGAVSCGFHGVLIER